MNLNNFTIQASEVVQSAQQAAFNAGNPTIETDHLLQGLLEQKNSPVEYLLKKNNVRRVIITESDVLVTSKRTAINARITVCV